PAIRRSDRGRHPPRPLAPRSVQRTSPRAERPIERLPFCPHLQPSAHHRRFQSLRGLPGGVVCLLSAPAQLVARIAGTSSPAYPPAFCGLRLHCRHDRSIPAPPISRTFRRGRFLFAAFSCALFAARMKRFYGVSRMPVRRPLASLIVLLFCCAAAAHAQLPGLTISQPTPVAKPESAVPDDPLGRETPRGSLLGFIKAAQDERNDVAIRYFQPPSGRRHRSEEDDEELVPQLLTIFNQKFAGALDVISRDPLGRLDDGLPADQERVLGALGPNEKYPILMVRLEDEQGRKLWYFSRATLDHVPEMFDSLTFPGIEKQIPQTLVTHRILAVPLWQWLAIILFVPVALVVGRLLAFSLLFLFNRLRRVRNKPTLPQQKLFTLNPVTLTTAILLHYFFVSYIGTSLLYRLYYRHLVWVFLAFDFYWILTRITRAISARIGASLTKRGMLAERSIVSLVRRFVEVCIFLLITLLVLRNLGVDVSTALAGVGIGGLALGLGAQKTFENMFGGVSILFDKVIQIGDTCRINNQ